MKAPGKPFMKAKNYCLFTYQFFGRILNDKLFNLFKWKKKKTEQNSLPISPCPQPLAPPVWAWFCLSRASFVAQLVKNPPAIWETWVQSLDREDPLEKEMATHSSILAWNILWSEEPGEL